MINVCSFRSIENANIIIYRFTVDSSVYIWTPNWKIILLFKDTSSEERIIDTVPTGPENKSNEDDNDGENVKHELLKCIENELQCNVCQEIYIKVT